MRFIFSVTLMFLAIVPAAAAGDANWYGASTDGSKVIFETTDNLSPADEDYKSDLYRYSGGQAQLISKSATAGNGAFDAAWEGNNADGSRVFFETREQLVASDTDAQRDVYQWVEGVGVSLVSFGVGGGNGPFDADYAGSSPDGTRVVVKTKEPLVGSDTDQQYDIFQIAGAGVGQLSTGPAGGNGAFDASFEAISDDGTRVFFYTAESLVAGDTDVKNDVYQRSAGTTTLVSTGPAGGNGAHGASFNAVSADGLRVLFSTTEALTVGDTDSTWDIYARQGGSTSLVSPSPNPAAEAEFISVVYADADATRVILGTDEQLVAGDTDATQDYYERYNGGYTLLTTGPFGGSGAFNASDEGASDDATVFVFSTSEKLVAADQDTAGDLYRRAGGQTTLVTPHTAAPTSGQTAFVSADGSRIAWYSNEAHLPADTDTEPDAYLWDSGSVTLASVRNGGQNMSQFTELVGMSADGSRLWLETDDALVDEDADDEHRDVFERSGGETKLVSRDAQPPDTTITNVPTGVNDKQMIGFGVETDDDNASIKCSVDGGEWKMCFTGSSHGPFSAGEHQLRARAVDDSGLVDPTPAEATFTIVSSEPAPASEPQPPAEEPGTQEPTTDQQSTTGDTTPVNTEPQSVKDTTAPVLSALSAQPRRFSLRSRTAARRGTVIGWKLSEAATLKFTVKRRVKKASGRVVWVKFASFKRAAKQGAGQRKLGKRIAGRRLKAGRYRVTVQARDAAGNSSASRSIRLKVTR